MSYKPLSKQQAEEMSRPSLIDDGQYQCELIEFSHTDKYLTPLKDKNGENMTRIKLLLNVEGKDKIIHTNLFWGENNKMSYRTRHFSESFQVLDMYELGELYDNFGQCLGMKGICDIYTQKGKPKNDGSNEVWPDKNDIKDFIVKDNNYQFNDHIKF